MYKRIITHGDFDGVICAAICSYALKINFIVFTAPRAISDARMSVTRADVVCDLPYPLECGMWFDHHEGNLDEVQFRKINPADIPGRFMVKDSCARVVLEYFSEIVTLPEHFETMVQEADVIDSFNYKSIADWRAETPGKIIDATIKIQAESAEQKWQYLRDLVNQIRQRPLDQVAQNPSVRKRYRVYQQEEQEMLQRIEQDLTFLPEDEQHQLIILDLTRHSRRPNVFKYLAYLLYPEAQAVLQVGNLFQNNIKTNDLSFSMSLSLNLNSVEHRKDVGEIMRQLDLGSGHAGAAAGTLPCKSKDEMLRNKEKITRNILELFKSQ